MSRISEMAKKAGDAAKAGVVKALDQNNDGKLDREDVEIKVSAYESRFPLGTIAVIALSCFMLGVWVHSLFK